MRAALFYSLFLLALAVPAYSLESREFTFS
jgi:hypothetical protein